MFTCYACKAEYRVDLETRITVSCPCGDEHTFHSADCAKRMTRLEAERLGR